VKHRRRREEKKKAALTGNKGKKEKSIEEAVGDARQQGIGTDQTSANGKKEKRVGCRHSMGEKR